MSDEKKKCLRALADYIKSNSAGWWFRVPTLSKTGGKALPVLTDVYLPCLESPLGLKTDTLVEGLICLEFLNLTKDQCKFNKKAWDAFKIQYELGDFLEYEACEFMKKEGGKGTIMSS